MSEENIKQEIKGLLYEEEQINQVLRLLNTILVSTYPQINAMNSIFGILKSPIPFTNTLDEKIE